MTDRLPDQICRLIKEFPELSPGTHWIGVELDTGLKVHDVLVQNGQVTQAGHSSRAVFDAARVVRAYDESERAARNVDSGTAPAPPGSIQRLARRGAAVARKHGAKVVEVAIDLVT